MYQELDREREENSRLMNRDYLLGRYESDLVKLFNGARSVTQAYLVLDSMEGRALAAEEKLAALAPSGMPVEREKLVRLIDPTAFEEGRVLLSWEHRRQTAEEKADAILALISGEPGAGK